MTRRRSPRRNSAKAAEAGIDSYGLQARSHKLRASLSEEMHVRKLPRIAAPCRLVQAVVQIGEAGQGQGVRGHVAALKGGPIGERDRYAAFPFRGVDLVWERHTEFASFTLIKPGAFDTPFDPDAFGEAGPALFADLPGEVVRATQIALLPKGAEVDDALLDAAFARDGLVVCDVAEGRARIWGDFKLNPDGFGRLLILDRDLQGDEAAQLVQRLQDQGNYRNMALLGLPLAQQLTPEVTELEERLAALTHDVSEGQAEDATLLAELSFLSAELARLLAETRYRMNATRAYGQLSFDRLASLHVAPVRGFQALTDFAERRLTPALRTCESFSGRLEDLSQRAAWTSSLLRTRVDTALARQNRDLLDSMNRRTRQQLLLQQAVEGVSVVAISYYLVNLIGDMLGAFPNVHREAAMAIAAPVVLLLVALVMWRLHKRIVE